VPPWNDYAWAGGGRPGLAKPDIAAPGVDLVSLAHDGAAYAAYWGTSAAAALVAGALAALLSALPLARPTELCEALARTARGGPDPRLGYGTIDVAAALAYARRRSGA
jgi:subtilisin family serine protease